MSNAGGGYIKAYLSLFADEYAGDGDLTDYDAYPPGIIAQKCGEGLGDYSWYPGARGKARSAGKSTIAYFWVLIREDGEAQAKQFVHNALDAEAFAVDLEQGPKPGHHAWNGGATKQEILHVMHDFFDTFHELKTHKMLLLYGASFMADKGITWTELVGKRTYVWAWLPRYDNGGYIRTWSKKKILDYALPGRYGVPTYRIAAVQFTNGQTGPAPHSLPGLNRNEDLSCLLIPFEKLTGGGDVDPRYEKFLKALFADLGVGPEKAAHLLGNAVRRRGIVPHSHHLPRATGGVWRKNNPPPKDPPPDDPTVGRKNRLGG